DGFWNGKIGALKIPIQAAWRHAKRNDPKRGPVKKLPSKCPKRERMHVIRASGKLTDITVQGDIMPKYLCIRRSQPLQSGKGEKPSPAQMEEMYAKFNAWKAKFQQNIVDMGGKLNDGGKVLTSEDSTDGPFVEAKEVVGGFMILAAKNVE